ncbi:MAG TPA: alcohol dehydrogenase catalytic domain-containing protein, partial [Opitutales bacterium]|nr:alcohol dehydrogenase catalytic domain-containing protein [Opitutales bacterium]
MLAVRHHEFGDPAEVLEVESLPVPEPGPGEVRVKLLAATINPSDYGMIGGSYGRLRELPAVAGREGLGEIDALGEGVDSVELGARV